LNTSVELPFCSRTAIHFRVIVVSFGNRFARAIFTPSASGCKPNSICFHPRRQPELRQSRPYLPESLHSPAIAALLPHADSMKRYEFNLRITADQYLNYYRGTARHVVAKCTTGQNIQFPAALLQQFVTTTGICGTFALTCDEENKNSRLERLQ